MTGRLSSLSPSPHFTTLGTSPASNLEIPPLPGAAEPDGSCSLPDSYYFRSRQWKGKGAGTTSKDGGRRRGETATWDL